MDHCVIFYFCENFAWIIGTLDHWSKLELPPHNKPLLPLCVVLLGKIYILPIVGQMHYIYYPIHIDWDWSRWDFKKALIYLKTICVAMFFSPVKHAFCAALKNVGFTNCRPSRWEPRKREFYVNVAVIVLLWHFTVIPTKNCNPSEWAFNVVK